MKKKSKSNTVMMFVSEPAFRRFSRIEKMCPFAQVMSKKPNVGQRTNSLEKTSHWIKFDGRLTVTGTSHLKKKCCRKKISATG